MPDSQAVLTKATFTFLFAVFTILVLTEPAYAYADPGTAGLLYQIIVIIFASLVSYFLFFKDFLRRLFRRKSEEQTQEVEKKD